MCVCLSVCPLSLFCLLVLLGIQQDPPMANITYDQVSSHTHTVTFLHGHGDPPTFTCTADGNPTPTLSWQVKSIISLYPSLPLSLLFSLSHLSPSFTPSFSHYLHEYLFSFIPSFSLSPTALRRCSITKWSMGDTGGGGAMSELDTPTGLF